MNAPFSTVPRWLAVSRLLWLLVWLVLVVYLGLTLWLGIVGLLYPNQLDYGEGIALWFSLEFMRGSPLYSTPMQPPFASSNYTPLSMVLAGILMPLLGQGYTSGRLPSFVAAILVAGLIYRIVRSETDDKRAGACAALFFIGSPYVYHWVPLFRADLPGLAFAIGGIYALWRYLHVVHRHGADEPGSRDPEESEQIDSGHMRYLVAAGLLFLLALYTKQTLLAAPVAAILALFQRNRRLASAFALALGLVGGGTFLAVEFATRGAFSFWVFNSNMTVFLLDQLLELAGNFAATFPILILLAVWGLALRVRGRQAGILEWYAVTATLACVMAGRIGAWENYFLEALTATCILAGVAVAELARSQSAKRGAAISVGLPALLLVQLVLMWHDPRIVTEMTAQDLAANQELAALIAETPGTIISEDMGALATSGRPVVFYGYEHSMLARSGQWDQHWELDGLNRAQFPLVILERGTRENVDYYRRFTREFLSALDLNYEHSRTIGKYNIYTPAPLEHSQTATYGETIGLVGWSVRRSEQDSRLVTITTVWQALRAIERRYTAFVHLESAGRVVAQVDREPLDGIYPTTRWAPGEMVRLVHSLRVPDQADDWVVRVGWYDTESGDRLRVPGSADDSVVLTTSDGQGSKRGISEN